MDDRIVQDTLLVRKGRFYATAGLKAQKKFKGQYRILKRNVSRFLRQAPMVRFNYLVDGDSVEHFRLPYSAILSCAECNLD